MQFITSLNPCVALHIYYELPIEKARELVLDWFDCDLLSEDDKSSRWRCDNTQTAESIIFEFERPSYHDGAEQKFRSFIFTPVYSLHLDRV